MSAKVKNSLRVVFELVDSDKSGHLEPSELARAITKIAKKVEGAPPEETSSVNKDELLQRANELVAQLDSNGDGKLSFEEVWEAMVVRVSPFESVAAFTAFLDEPENQETVRQLEAMLA
eukprot:CAMPEP_0172155844 /NCGR_PEP_ID=MMETSP1050-20130122/2855_1 /TAXON_ID=233186 /ORGANISM="Cryptomonas curvata, Strain CCAP979/52" /LENGTH=118 /DNA_ID=CAMNT_0012824795 /DNA_START=41 /DNA_END=393 /DNA_ORIENTATION=-